MIFTKTSIGFSHIANKKPCQDFSSSYQDENRIILTCSDGHGGDLYCRSQYGSKFASDALMKTFLHVEKHMLNKPKINKTIEKLKLNILCEWNTLVENHLKKHPISKRDILGLSTSDILRLKRNPVKAYGTTLCGALIIGDKIICIQIGDGGAFIMHKNKVTPIFPDNDDEQVGNLTYSMCEDDAFIHMQTKVVNRNCFDGLLLCTDGVINPYRNYKNFTDYFVVKVTKDMKEGKYKDLENFIVSLGQKNGLGDDVSLCAWIK